jgi:hypothetical protein
MKIFSETVIKVQVPLPKDRIIDCILDAIQKMIALMNKEPVIIVISPKTYIEFSRQGNIAPFKYSPMVGDSVSGVKIVVERDMEDNVIELRSKPERVDL